MSVSYRIVSRSSPFSGPCPVPFGSFAPVRRGFTMVEMVVVVAIIAVLISLLLPAMTSARSVANLSVCASNNRQIYLGLASYSGEYQDSIIYDDASGNTGSKIWWQRLSDDTGPTYTPGIYRGTTWICPLAESDAPAPHWKYNNRWDAHYALNQTLVQQYWYTAGVNVYHGGAAKQFRLGQQRSDLGFLADGPISYFPAAGGGYYFLETWNTGSSPMIWPLNSAQVSVGRAHGGGANMGYCDGHVALVNALTTSMIGPAQ